MDISQVQFVEPNSGLLRTIYLYEGISVDEVKETFKISFNLKTAIIGFRDESGVFYIFSSVALSPKTFDGQSFQIVLESFKSEYVQEQELLLSDISGEVNYYKRKAEVAFQLLDLNEDNLVHKEEFIEFLTIAYSQLFDRNSRYGFAYSCLTPKDLAVTTSVQCYNSVDTHDNYSMTFNDFCGWYLSSGFDLFRDVARKALENYSSSVANEKIVVSDDEKILKRSKSRPSLDLSKSYSDSKIQSFIKNCRYYLSLDEKSVLFLLTSLQSCISRSNYISRSKFTKLFYDLNTSNNNYNNNSFNDNKQRTVVVELLDLIFNLLEPTHKDKVSVFHLASLLCILQNDKNNSSYESFKSFFRLFQANEDCSDDNDDMINNSNNKNDKNYANEDILYIFLCQIFRLIFHFNPQLQQSCTCFAQDLAHAIATKFLLCIDVTRKKKFKLSFEEFVETFIHGLKFGLDVLEIKFGFFVSYLQSLIGYEAVVEKLENKNLKISKLNVNDDANDVNNNNIENSIIAEDENFDNFENNININNSSTTNVTLEDSQIESFFVEYCGDVIALVEAKTLLGLQKYAAATVVHHFKSFADSKGLITDVEYQKLVVKLVGKNYISLTVLQRSVVDFVIDRLFRVFDVHDSGACNIRLLGCAVLLFCGDSFETRARLAFDLLKNVGHSTTPTNKITNNNKKVNNRKFLNPLVVTQCLSDLLKARACLDPSVVDFEVLDEKCTEQASDLVFKMNDERKFIEKHDENGLVSEEDFVDLFVDLLVSLENYNVIADNNNDNNNINGNNKNNNLSFDDSSPLKSEKKNNNNNNNTIEQQQQTFSDDEDEEQQNIFLNDVEFPPSSVVLELRAAAAVLGLDKYKCDDMLESLGQQAHMDMLSLKNWKQWLRSRLEQAKISKYDLQIAMSLGEQLFNAYSHSYSSSATNKTTTSTSSSFNNNNNNKLKNSLSNNNIKKNKNEDEDEVSFSNIACGLSFLCNDSPLVEKVMVAFTVMDNNSDGYISCFEFKELVLSVLTMVNVCSRLASSKIVQSNVSINVLAEACKTEGLTALNINNEANADLSLEMVSEIVEDYLKLAVLY